MIKINLLPIDRRRPERTPLPRFIAILAGTMFTLSFFVFIAYIYVVKYTGMVDAFSAKQKMLQDMKKDNTDYAALKAEYDYLAESASALDQIEGTRRLVWWKMLDKLCTIFDENKAWLTTFSGTMAGEKPDVRKDSATKKEYEILYELKLGILTAGQSFEPPTAIRTRLYEAFRAFESPSDPKNPPAFEITQINQLTPVAQPDYVEKAAMSFDLKLSHLQEKVKAQKPAPAAKPAEKK